MSGGERRVFRPFGPEDEETKRLREELWAELRANAEERQREKQEAKLREDRLFALAEAAHKREEDADTRNRRQYVITILSLLAAIAAIVVPLID
ncbi:hypothetical protein [Blastococcus sp. SYSU D00813]